MFAAFIAGALFSRFKPFPYNLATQLLRRAKSVPARVPLPTEATVQSQLSRDLGDPLMARDLETALIPVKISGFQLSREFDLAKTAGGIAVIGNQIAIVDRLGNVFLFTGERLEKRAFPPLPNNVASFLASGAFPLTPSTLRVHDAEYVSNPGRLLVSHEYYDSAGKAPRLVVSAIEVDPTTLEPKGDWIRVFTGDLLKTAAYAGLAGGGRMAIRNQDQLLLTTGDYNQDNVSFSSAKVSLDASSSFGKIFEVHLPTLRRQLISLGHRNSQGLVLTSKGELLATEHGPAGGDELNRIVPGGNYGWPEVTLGVDYGTYSWPTSSPKGEHSGYIMPLFAWVPSIGVANLIEIRNFDPSWNGDLLVASLKAASLFRLRVREQRVIYSEPIWIGDRIRDLAQMKDGRIALWTDDGKLLFLSVDQAKLAANRRSLDISAPPILAMCMGCHHLGETNPNHAGPSLTNIIGSKIASDSFPRYSEGLKGRSELWTVPLLRTFLSDPPAFAQGTLMPKLPLSSEDLDRLVAYLSDSKN